MSSGFLGGGVGPTAIKRRSGLAAPVPVAGAELIVNGTFDDATGWPTLDAPWSISGGKLSSGAASGFPGAWSSYAAPVWGIAEFDYVAHGGSQIQVRASSIPVVFGAATGTSGRTVVTGLFSNGNFALRTNGASNIDIDNCSLKPITLSSMFSTRSYYSADCDLSVAVTRTAGTQAGLVARLDNPTNPQNFIIAHNDGADRVRLLKCVAGVYTILIETTATYAAGRVLRLVCSGNNVSAYYNGVQVGTTQTVSDAGITGNKNHGLFSTYAANTFSGYVAA